MGSFFRHLSSELEKYLNNSSEIPYGFLNLYHSEDGMNGEVNNCLYPTYFLQLLLHSRDILVLIFDRSCMGFLEDSSFGRQQKEQRIILSSSRKYIYAGLSS